MFLTNPAPICVLDEVDAPLDDHNVERFCDLLDEMTKSTDTRFVIITHNPITMARMNRLFGVTMAERGVSQLVSVDLEGAVKTARGGVSIAASCRQSRAASGRATDFQAACARPPRPKRAATSGGGEHQRRPEQIAAKHAPARAACRSASPNSHGPATPPMPVPMA